MSSASNLTGGNAGGRRHTYASLGCPYDEGPLSGAVRSQQDAYTGHTGACLLATAGV